MAEIRDVRGLAHEMREYIETHGWIQGRQEDPTGAVCLTGALVHAAGWERHVGMFFAAFHRTTGALLMHWWNDAPERTYEDVIFLLKQIEDGA